MRVTAILNPRAGLAAERARQVLEAGTPGWAIEIVTTRHAGHARELAEAARRRGDDVVLAVGGDGTANEVASALVGSEVALGLLPVGSGNGLARLLRIPLAPRRALDELAGAVRRRMDVGRLNGELFLNVAGTGFDAEVAIAFHAWGQRGRRRGIFPYVWLAAREAFRFKADVRRVEVEGQAVELPIFLATFANGRQYGAGAVIAPRARLDDGRLDLVVVDACSPLAACLGAPRMFTGRLESFRHYHHWSCASATITGSRPIAQHRDGEAGGRAERVDVSVEPRALVILVPRRTADDPHGPFDQTSV